MKKLIYTKLYGIVVSTRSKTKIDWRREVYVRCQFDKPACCDSPFVFFFNNSIASLRTGFSFVYVYVSQNINIIVFKKGQWQNHLENNNLFVLLRFRLNHFFPRITARRLNRRPESVPIKTLDRTLSFTNI
jgi:hypothetical protein